MTLPFDFSRCPGTKATLCQNCARTDPGDPYRQSVFTTPPIEYGLVACKCDHHIKRTEYETLPT